MRADELRLYLGASYLLLRPLALEISSNEVAPTSQYKLAGVFNKRRKDPYLS
jgi:hypothetical protein